MKKYGLIISFLMGVLINIDAQFINNGAIVTIQSGATLRIETNLDNQLGTIDNQGTLEIQGNFTNAVGPGTTLQGNGNLRFIGTSNSNLDTGGDALNNVILAKSTSAGTVTLTSPTTINTSLTFSGTTDGGKILLGSHDLTMGTSATTTGATATTGYVVTGSTGRVIKTALGAAPFTFPVGFDINTYNPITISENGTADNIGVRVLEHAYVNGSSGAQVTTEAVNATWNITESNSGNSNLNITTEWYASDELPSFTRIECGIGKYNGSTFDLLSADLNAASGSNPYTSTRNGVSPGNFMVGDDKALDYVSVNAKVFLGGPSFASNEMGDQLRVSNLVPLAQPYSSAPYNTAFAHAGRGGKGIEFVNSVSDFNLATGNGTQDDVVDWVFLELRDSPTNVIATKSAILQRDGDIVEAEDFTPVKFRGINDGNYFLVIRHRNHLGIRTASTVAMSSTPNILNFTNGSVSTFGTDAQGLLSGVYSMWSGDVNNDGFVNATDRAETWNLRNQIGYIIQDASLNGTVDASDRATTWNNRNKSIQY